jgi:mono/diheme cytochrome c family protein
MVVMGHHGRMRLPTRTARSLGRWTLLLALVAAVASACGGADAPRTEQAAADGAALYAANCAACHGAEGEGTSVGPPLAPLIYEPGHHSDESFRRAMSDGVVPHHWEFGPMPPQPQVGEGEADAIIAHVRDLQREAGIID